MSADGEVCFQTASALARLIQTRQVTCRDVVEAYVQRIEELNPNIGAVATVDVEGARERAADLDRLLSEGAVLGPLHGVPITIKDTLETIGLRTTSGSRRFANHIPSRDAESVRRLRTAGAVVLGKDNVPPLAGDYQTSNDIFGTTSNPWDNARTAGGSSGGCAASIASGFSALALGSDTAGSLSLPAHYCGVFAHKPSFGLVPTLGHVPPTPGSRRPPDLLVVGPLARCAADLDLAMTALTQPVELRTGGLLRSSTPDREPRPVGVLNTSASPFDVDSSVATRFDNVVETLRRAGLNVIEFSPTDVGADAVIELAPLFLGSASSANFSDTSFLQLVEWVHADGHVADQGEWGVLSDGVVMRHRDWLQLDERRHRMREQWRQLFREIEVLIAPVSPVVAFRHQLGTADRFDRSITINGTKRPYFHQTIFPSIASVCYLPATVVPAGITDQGLPMAVQIIGDYLADSVTLAFARQLESLGFGYDRPPLLGAPQHQTVSSIGTPTSRTESGGST